MNRTRRLHKHQIIGYVRVSTANQAEEGHSLVAQEHSIKQWAKNKGGEIVEIYSDRGLSGKDTNRPGLQAAINHACELGTKNKEKKLIIFCVYAFSRASRSVKDALGIIEELEKSKVQVASVTEPIDTTTAMGRAFFSIVNVFSQLERDLVAERTKATLSNMRQENRRISRHIPYGWRQQSGRGSKTLVAHPIEQRGLQAMEKLREEGCSYRDIAKRMDEMGYPPKQGKEWSPGVIKRILDRVEKLKEEQ